MEGASTRMKIIYSNLAKEHLLSIKKYISADNKAAANKHLQEIKKRIEIIKDFPYIGKENSTLNSTKIREFVILGYKAIYKINNNTLVILAIYKLINLNESKLLENPSSE